MKSLDIDILEQLMDRQTRLETAVLATAEAVKAISENLSSLLEVKDRPLSADIKYYR